MVNRREFLRTASCVSLGTALPAPWVVADDSAAQQPPFIQLERLTARNQNRSTVTCQRGLVCASQPLAAMAGVDILQAGGNCVDAALATNAVLGVTEPASNGMGGDLFAIVWIESDQKLYGLNASGRAPYDWNLAAAQALGLEEIPRISPLSWTVPGCVSGWGALNQRFGRFRLGQCLEAAIHYAAEGFPLSPLISLHFDFDPEKFPSLAPVYHPQGRKPRYGDVFRNPDLATSLRTLAAGGPDAFYQGEIGQRIVECSRQLGGRLSLRDLRDHQPNWVRAGQQQLSWLGRVGTPAQWPGHCGTADLEHPGNLRPCGTGTEFCRASSSVDRGQEVGV